MGIRMVEDRTFDVVLSGVVVTGAEQCGLAAHAVAANAIPYLVVDGFKNCMSLGVCGVWGGVASGSGAVSRRDVWCTAFIATHFLVDYITD